MAEIANHAGKEGPWLSLEAASWLFDRASFVLVGSLVLGVIATIVIVWTGIAKEHHWELLRESAGEEIARANTAAAMANAATEAVRKQNLELELSMTPRGLDQGSLIEALRPFAGTHVYFSVLPDFEATRFAEQLNMAFGTAGLVTHLFKEDAEEISDGVQIKYVAGEIWPDPRTAPFEVNPKGKAAAKIIFDHLQASKIEATERAVSPIMTVEVWFHPTVPRDALIVRVGMKPTTYLESKQRDGLLKDAKGPFIAQGNRVRLPKLEQP